MTDWLTCTRCGLYKTRRQVVLGRGEIPADLLFVGEAPGKSEDLRGLAFVGPSGRILDAALREVRERLGFLPSYYISNTVACRPTDERGGPNREPTLSEVLTCRARLIELESEVRPEAIVLLGATAKYHCGSLFPAHLALYHPAYLLRRGGQTSTEYRVFVRELEEYIGRTARRRLARRKKRPSP